MASSTMPPPPHPFAHRRTPRLITRTLATSSLEPEECILRKMSKGATFHQPSSRPSDLDPVLSIPHLTRRSPTCSSSILASWLSGKEDVAQSIADFEETFSGARGKKSSTRRSSAQKFEQELTIRRATLPSDEGLGSSLSPASDKGLSKSFERALDLISNKDSGLGSSVRSDKLAGSSCEEDGLAQDLIQETDHLDPASRRSPRDSRASTRTSSTTIPRSAVTQSIAPPSRPSSTQPSLSSFAKKKIRQNIINPILDQDRFQPLHRLVSSLGARNNKHIKCLRDLEQSLIFQPLTRAISRQLYRTFGEFTIQLVVDSYQHLSESEQRRASDRPYDNGYFLDLVQQVNRLASGLGSSSSAQAGESTEDDDDDMAFSIDDEITLEGGLDETGNFAELVRWKNGKGISLRTGQPYEPLVGLKRQNTSEMDEDIARSMARRKKGYIPEYVEMKCSDKNCTKTFTRKCDLSKHEKTHSRPYKCKEPNCKYHEAGLPTEKELERHWNDKHSSNPLFYKCDYCEFKTKRESNCKQHMEKKHGWTYERAKGKDKAIATIKSSPAQTPLNVHVDYSPSPAVSVRTGSVFDDNSSIAGSIPPSAAMTPFEPPQAAFDNTFGATNVTYSNPIFPRAGDYSMQYPQTLDDFDFNSFPTNMPTSAYISPTNTTPSSHMMGTPITPTFSNITEPSPYSTHMDMTLDCPEPGNWNAGLPTPNSFLQAHSRNPSISSYSPMITTSTDQIFEDEAVMTNDYDLPMGDFALFGNSGSNAFANTVTENLTLFPTDPEAYAILDNNAAFNDSWAEQMFDFSMDGKTN